MTIEDIAMYRKQPTKSSPYYSELFSKPIWGDMGEDCASIYLTPKQNHWHLHFIRTQSGEPYPLSETVCNIVDEYEKELSDSQVYELLLLHNKMKEFEDYYHC